MRSNSNINRVIYSKSPVRSQHTNITKNPLDRISSQINVLRQTKLQPISINDKNMGHGQHEARSIRMVEKKSFYQRKNTFDSTYGVDSQVYSRSNNQIRVSSKKSSMVFDEEADEDNNFIKIPKVKINYSKPNVVRNKFRKFNRHATQVQTDRPRHGHFQNRKSWQNQQNHNALPVKRGYINSKSPARRSDQNQWSSSSIPRSRNLSSTGANPLQSDIKGKVTIFDNMPTSKKRFNEMDKNMHLGFDVFSNDSSILSKTGGSSVFSTSEISQLSRKIMMTSEIHRQKKSETPGYMKSMFNIKQDMTSTKEQAIPQKHDFQKSKTRVTSSTALLEESLVKQESESPHQVILRRQKAKINSSRLNDELNKFLKSDFKTYSNSVLDLNSELNKLKMQYRRFSQKNKNVDFLRQKVDKKKNQLLKKELQLNMLNDSESADLLSDVKTYESRLSQNEIKDRKRRLKRLRKLEKKIKKYKNVVDNLDSMFTSQSKRMLSNKDATIENELEELKTLLEDDNEDKMLIEKMEKMLKNHNLLD